MVSNWFLSNCVRVHTCVCVNTQTCPIEINLLTPNANYSGRTASLTSKVAFCIFIKQI